MFTNLSDPTIIIVILIFAVYMIARQFMEQPVSSGSLLIFPLLVAYISYTHIVAQLAHPLVSVAFVIAGLIIGLLPGLLLGFARANAAKLRLDRATGVVYARPGVAGITIWLVVLIIKIISGVALYTGLAHASILGTLLIALTTTLFLGYILTYVAFLSWRAARFRSGGQVQAEQRLLSQVIKW